MYMIVTNSKVPQLRTFTNLFIICHKNRQKLDVPCMYLHIAIIQNLFS